MISKNLALTNHYKFPAYFLIISYMVTALPAIAQENAAYLSYLEQLTKINSYAPEQSPIHERGSEILNDRLLDSKNRVVGEVHDVVFNAQGEIIMLEVEFSRLRRGRDKVMIDYEMMQVESAGNGYRAGFNTDQIEEMYSNLLKSSRSYKSRKGLLRLTKLGKAIIKNKSDKKLGQVGEVLFDSVGSKAEFLYVHMNYNGNRGAGVAVPFDAFRYVQNGSSIEGIIADEAGDAMGEVAKN